MTHWLPAEMKQAHPTDFAYHRNCFLDSCHPKAISSWRTELELSSVASASGPCFDTFISAAVYLIPTFSSLERLHDRFRNYLFHISRVSTISCCSPYIPDVAVIVVTIVTMLFPGLLRRPGKDAAVDQATACRDDLFFIVFITLFVTLFIVFTRFGHAEHSWNFFTSQQHSCHAIGTRCSMWDHVFNVWCVTFQTVCRVFQSSGHSTPIFLVTIKRSHSSPTYSSISGHVCSIEPHEKIIISGLRADFVFHPVTRLRSELPRQMFNRQIWHKVRKLPYTSRLSNCENLFGHGIG